MRVEVIVAVDPWGSFDLREGVQPGPALQSLDPESLPLQNGFPVQPFLKIVQISSLVDLRPARRGALHLRDHGILLGASGLVEDHIDIHGDQPQRQGRSHRQRGGSQRLTVVDPESARFPPAMKALDQPLADFRQGNLADAGVSEGQRAEPAATLLIRQGQIAGGGAVQGLQLLLGVHFPDVVHRRRFADALLTRLLAGVGQVFFP